MDLLAPFRDSLRQFRKDKTIRYSHVEDAAGLRSGYLSDFLRGVDSKGIMAAVGAARKYGFDLEDLLLPPGYTRDSEATEFIQQTRGAKAFLRPTVEQVADLLDEREMQLTPGDPILRFVELFQRPDPVQLVPRPFWVGAKSHLAMESGVVIPQDIDDLLSRTDRKQVKGLARSHIQAFKKGKSIKERSTKLFVPPDYILLCSYNRLLTPVRYTHSDIDEDMLLVFCEPTGRVGGRDPDHPKSRQGLDGPAFLKFAPFERQRSPVGIQADQPKP